MFHYEKTRLKKTKKQQMCVSHLFTKYYYDFVVRIHNSELVCPVSKRNLLNIWTRTR
jgi:hypothetical protein